MRRVLLSLVFGSAALCSALSIPTVDVAIIGGGPCGLAAAIALRKTLAPAATIAVFERDAALKPQGSSVGISPAGWAAIKSIDATVCKRLHQKSTVIESLGIFPFVHVVGQDSKPAAPYLALGALRVIGLVNAVLRFLRLPRLAITRINLWHEARSTLKQRVDELCGEATLRTDHTLAKIAEAPEGGFDLEFDNAGGGGSKKQAVHARVVLACDGARSTCRDLSPREPSNEDVLVDEEKSVWRGNAVDVDVRGRCNFLIDTAGDGGKCLSSVFPAAGGGAAWTVTGPSAPGSAADSEDARQRLRSALPPRDPTYEPLEQLHRCVDLAPFVLERRIKCRVFGPEAPPFCSNTPGLAFLGDAAHPVRPTGEGLALAFEDAWQLAAVIKASPDKSLGPDELRCYEAARLPRVRQVSEFARAQADSYYAKKQQASTDVLKNVKPLRPTPL